MPTYRIQAPNGRTYQIEGPPGATQAQVIQEVLRQYPDAETPLPPPEGGFTAAFKGGLENLKGQAALTAGKAGLMDPKAAEAYNAAQQQRSQQIFKPTEDSFIESPIQNLKELAGGSAPYMVAPLVAAGGAAALGAPAAIGAGAAGLASLGQFVGTNLDRSMEENQTSLENTSGSKALAAAIPQAALDVVGFRFIPGIGKLFGAAGQKVTTETAKQMAQQTAKQIAAEYAKKTGQAMTVEGLTETMQQVLERAQAGISTVSPEARGEYIQSFFGGALLAGTLSPAGRFVERGSEKRQSLKMAEDEEKKKAAEAAAAQQAREQALIEAERNAPSASMPETGARQSSIPGLEGTPDAAPTPAPQEDPVQRAGFLRNTIPQIDARMDEIRQQNMGGATLAERTERERQMEQLRQAKKLAEEELKSLNIEDPAAAAKKLASLQKQLEKADNNGDTAKALQIAQQIDAMGGVQGTLDLGRTRQIDIEGNNTRAFDQLNRAELADREALLKQQRPGSADTNLDLLRDSTEQADTARDDGNFNYELDQVSKAAEGTADATQQPRLFGEPEGAARVGSGLGAPARSEAEIVADLAIARASRDKARTSDIVEELRALRNENRDRDTQAKAGPAGADIRSQDLEQASGMRIPEETARRQSFSDARVRAFGQMVSTLDRFNRGRADGAALKQAEQGVVDNLVREIEGITGQPLSTAERQTVMAQARDLLADLKNRFGDTREEVNTGTRKNPEMEPVQRRSGEFRKDLPGPGAGPTGMGLENQETRNPGERTFSNRYAAAQSIQEGLDQIRNRRAGTQETAPGTDRTDSNRSNEDRLATAQAQAKGTPAEPLVQQVLDSKVKTPSLVDNAVQAAMRAQRGQDIAEQQQALNDELALMEQGKRSETEGGKTAVQSELFNDRGTLFNNWVEFDDWMASDALVVLKMANGQINETLSRAVKMVAPLQKRVADLEGKVQKLVAQKAAWAEERGTEEAASRKDMDAAAAAVMEAQDVLDFATIEYTEALAEAEQKLQAAYDADAQIAEQIAQNLQGLNQAERMQGRELTALRKAQTRLIGLSRELADAKQKLASYTPTLFSSTDPISRPKLAEFNRLEKQVADLEQALLTASVQARAAHVPGLDQAVSDGKALAEFQKRAAELSKQRLQQSRRIGGFKAARNRAQTQLDAALMQLETDPEFQAQRDRKARADEMLALAKSRRADSLAGIRSTDGELEAINKEVEGEAGPVKSLRRQAAERIRDAKRGVAPTGEKETQLDRETRDGERRKAEQETLETRQNAPGTTRESVSFEPRRLDQENLDEASTRMAALEDILSRVPMNEEQRAVFEEAAAEYAARTTALEKKAQARLENVEGKLAAQRKRIEMLQRAQERYDAAEADSPARAKAQELVARLRDALEKQGQKISKAWGIQRERIVSAAEKRAAPDTRSQAKKNSDALKVETLAEGQPTRRATSPTMRETKATRGFRSGDTTARADETAQDAATRAQGIKGDKPTRLVESRALRERDLPISKAEQQAANAAAAQMKADAARANAEAEKLKKTPRPKRTKQVEDAKTVAQTILNAQADSEKARGPKTRTQSAIDDFDPLDADDAVMREDGDFYAARSDFDVDEETAEALFDGRLPDALDDIAANGATPLLREVAKRLRPMLLRTRVRVQPMLRVQNQSVAAIFIPERNEIVVDNSSMTQGNLLHEAVHAATLRAISGDVPLDASQQRALADLTALYETMKRDPAFESEYANKDLGEFIAELMVNQETRDKIDAAQGRGFLDKLYDGLLRLLGIKASDKATEDVYRLFTPSRPFKYNMAAVPRIMAGVFPDRAPQYAADIPQSVREQVENTVGRDPSIADKIMANVAGFRAQFVDRFDPYETLLKKGVAKGMISDIQAAQFSYFMRFGEQRNQFVEQAATYGVPQLRKVEGDFVIETPEGSHPNLMKIAAALAKANVGNEAATEKLFTQYLAVLRGEQVGFDKLNFDEPMTPAMAKGIKDTVNADPQRKAAFESARKMYRDYNDQMLDLMTQLGAMNKSTAAALKRGDYVPYYRQDANGVVNLIIAGETPVRVGNIKDQPYLAELVGGNDKILPFFSGAMQNTSMLIDMAMRNKQAMEVSNLIQALGLGKIRKGASNANNSVSFKIDGDPVHLNIDDAVDTWGVPADLLIKSLEGIKTTIPAALRFMQMPADLLRTMVTRAPAYAIRQIIREPINAWLVSGGNFTPVVSSVKELAKIVQGKSEGAKSLERSGAVSSNVITGDQQDKTRILRDISQGKNTWQKVMMAADKFAMEGDTATRAVLYDKFRKQGMTHMQATLGALESMNFARRGLSPTMQMMSMLVPFFNAQIQGLDVIYRAATGRTTFEQKLDVQRKLIARGAMMTAATLAYTAMMQDDEAYKNATPTERAQNWFLPLPGMDEALKVPIPFELGFAFKAIPEVIANTAFGDTKAEDAMKAMGTLAYQTIPIGMPQAIKPALEVMTNYSFYTGENIEGRREQQLQTAERFRDNTTELAKMLGKAGVISPVQIDYLMRGYLGGLGLTMISLASNPLKLVNPSEELAPGATKKASQTPLLGALFQPADGRGVINEAFKDIESWQQASQTYKRMVEQGRMADAKKFAQDFSTQIALNTTGGAFRQQLGELAQIRRGILASKTLTPQEKRAQVDQIRQVELQLARQIREAAARAGG